MTTEMQLAILITVTLSLWAVFMLADLLSPGGPRP